MNRDIVIKDCVFVSNYEAKPWARPWMFSVLGLGSHRVAPQRPGGASYRWQGEPPAWVLRWFTVPPKYGIWT